MKKREGWGAGTMDLTRLTGWRSSGPRCGEEEMSRCRGMPAGFRNGKSEQALSLRLATALDGQETARARETEQTTNNTRDCDPSLDCLYIGMYLIGTTKNVINVKHFHASAEPNTTRFSPSLAFVRRRRRRRSLRALSLSLPLLPRHLLLTSPLFSFFFS